MYTRSDEREAGAAYQHWLGSGSLSAKLARFFMGPIGAFFVNTPLFLLQRRVRITGEMRVLDIGCGRATALRFLAGRIPFSRPPVGLDVAPAILRLAHCDGADAPFVELAAATTTRLPFARDSFDLILCSYVIHHLGDAAMDRFLYECHRVLRPEGQLIVWDYAPTRSNLLNRFHCWLLTRETPGCQLRGYRNLANLVVETTFASVELVPLRPFLFPPIPRVAVMIRKASAVELPNVAPNLP